MRNGRGHAGLGRPVDGYPVGQCCAAIRCSAFADGSADAPTTTARTPPIHEVHDAPARALYPSTHGAMNNSTPKTMCTYSLTAEPGTASDQSPVSASTTPSTTKDHTAAADVVTTIGESATNTPITRAAQSC